MVGDQAPDVAAEAADEEMAEADSSGDSSSSDSDFEELTISAEDTKMLMQLEQQLQDNPNLYDSHVQVRHACRQRPTAQLVQHSVAPTLMQILHTHCF